MSLLRDPETGHLVGIEQAPAAAPAEHRDYPKWVTPDPSHVATRADGGRSVAGFEHHIDRAGNLTVLVKDAAEEADALAPKCDKTRLRLVPDVADDPPEARPLSPLWPKQEEPGPAIAPEAPKPAEPAPSVPDESEIHEDDIHEDDIF